MDSGDDTEIITDCKLQRWTKVKHAISKDPSLLLHLDTGSYVTSPVYIAAYWDRVDVLSHIADVLIYHHHQRDKISILDIVPCNTLEGCTRCPNPFPVAASRGNVDTLAFLADHVSTNVANFEITPGLCDLFQDDVEVLDFIVRISPGIIGMRNRRISSGLFHVYVELRLDNDLPAKSISTCISHPLII
jgi:hypothetical protein